VPETGQRPAGKGGSRFEIQQVDNRRGDIPRALRPSGATTSCTSFPDFRMPLCSIWLLSSRSLSD
jgi:hypothetical protein